MLFFYESNNSLQGKESVDDDVGLDFSMGRLQIEDGDPQREKKYGFKECRAITFGTSPTSSTRARRFKSRIFKRVEICLKSPTRSNYR